MKEGWQLSIYIILAILIAFAGYFIINHIEYDGSLVVNEYEAHFSLNNFKESYEYAVNNHFTMLYRVWNAPLFYNNTFDKPYIQLIGINCSYIPYIKDYYGNVFIINKSNDYKQDIEEKAYYNEVGCYNPDGYKKGFYKINSSYEIYPPVQYDGKFYHANIKIASKHVPYKNFVIYIDNSSGNIAKIFTHPPFYISKNNSTYIIKGKSQKNGLIEIEFLFNSLNPKFLYSSENVKEKTIDSNKAYYFNYAIAKTFSYFIKSLVIFFPVILLLIYYVYGRERKFTVPKYLSFIPKKRKPWLVNLVFKKDATDFDKDGFYATLLDLHRKGNIKIEGGEDLKISIINKSNLDDYERKVISFIERHSYNKIFSLESFKEEIEAMEGNTYEITNLKDEVGELYKVKDAKDFIVNGRHLMLKFFILSFAVFIISMFFYLSYFNTYPILFEIFGYSFLLSMQFLMTVFSPSTLFGKWKKDYYEEKMEWNSFKRFLLDMAHLEKYKVKDIVIWKEWLVYATALGVGKKVSQALKKLNIQIPEADMIPFIYIYFASMDKTIATTYSSTVGKNSGGFAGGGGGFGAGGGFGGGGAGGR